jgi:hypothetical protein
MAQNFLDQVLTLTGLKLPDAKNSPPPIYRDDASTEKKSNNLSSVERYQRQKNTQPRLTGTAKYLAKKQQQADKKIETLTGVDKYLAKKRQILQEKSRAEAKIFAQMTGVEKYLFKLDANKKVTPSEKIKVVAIEKTETTKQSSVEKYLAKQKQTEAIVVTENIKEVEIEVEAALDEEAVIIKEDISEEIPAAVDEDDSKVEQEADVEIETSEIINLAEGATQCQAATVRGSQCRRKSNLMVVEKMVTEQRYKFAICRQHDNDTFTPFEGLFK